MKIGKKKEREKKLIEKENNYIEIVNNENIQNENCDKSNLYQKNRKKIINDEKKENYDYNIYKQNKCNEKFNSNIEENKGSNCNVF